MSSAGERGGPRAEQGIEAWARHGIEEYDEREAMDRAERGLDSQLDDDPAEPRQDDPDVAEHPGSGVGSESRADPADESTKSVES
jgi:hypothetical protein